MRARISVRWKLMYALMAGMAITAATFLPISVISYSYLHKEDDYIPLATSRIASSGEFKESHLSNRSVMFDIENNLISEAEGKIALGNVNNFLDEVQNKCSSKMTGLDYLSCSNALLRQHFYYKPSRTVTRGWAAHFSDCDLNVYLLIDAMALAGKEAKIVYAPGHAFLAFTDEKSGETDYWETTLNHNAGAHADLSSDSYKKTPATFYYEPFSGDFAEALYPVVVLKDIPGHESREHILAYLQKHLTDNPFAQDILYSIKTNITRQDAIRIAQLLQSDITSTTKAVILSQYLMTHHQEEKARDVIQRVPDSVCYDECIEVRSVLFPQYTLQGIISDHLITRDIPLSLEKIQDAMLFSVDIYLLIIFVVVCTIKKVNTRQCQKEEPADDSLPTTHIAV